MWSLSKFLISVVIKKKLIMHFFQDKCPPTCSVAPMNWECECPWPESPPNSLLTADSINKISRNPEKLHSQNQDAENYKQINKKKDMVTEFNHSSVIWFLERMKCSLPKQMRSSANGNSISGGILSKLLALSKDSLTSGTMCMSTVANNTPPPMQRTIPEDRY